MRAEPASTRTLRMLRSARAVSDGVEGRGGRRSRGCGGLRVAGAESGIRVRGARVGLGAEDEEVAWLRCGRAWSRVACGGALSRTTRRSGRRRGRLVRSVSEGLSARTVPMPVRMASEAWRRSWTSARAAVPVSQCGAVAVRAEGGGASLPSTESAALRVTKGR